MVRTVLDALYRRIRPRVAGRFQPYNYTLPDRYPWLFRFAAERLERGCELKILSFGCSRGDEVFALRKYFPGATIRGIDADPRNISMCRARSLAQGEENTTFVTAATTHGEEANAYDAIFCLAVLCHGDLTASGARRSDPLFRFDEFERAVTDLARCLKPGGLLLLHSTNFRFCDTMIARCFDVVLEAEASQLGTDVLFDRRNMLLEGEQYRAVAFQKRISPGCEAAGALPL